MTDVEAPPLTATQPAYGAATVDAPLIASTPAASTKASSSAPAATAASAPAPDETQTRSGPRLPAFLTTPVEACLSVLGKFCARATDLIGTGSASATSRARPWLEFFDLSAFKPADGWTGYVDRLRINTPYFLFNYVIVGLALSGLSVITKPLALAGAVLLIWVYFQFFGAETGDGDYYFFGFSLDTYEKVGVMVVLGFIVFWITAGGFQIFFSVLTATAFVTLLHGAMRKPSQAAYPATSSV